ncbi:MAG: c-type cytochrome [Pseudomonadota bacterium]
MLRGLAVIVVLFAVSGPASARPKPDPVVERGREVAEKRCASCHSVAPGGASPMRDAPAFAGRDMQHTAGLEGRLAALTRKGHYDMPPMTLSPDEVTALRAYIESLAPRQP